MTGWPRSNAALGKADRPPLRLLYSLYTNIYCCWTGCLPPFIFPQRDSNFANYVSNCQSNSVPARTGLCAPPVSAIRQTLRLPLFQRLRFIWDYEIQCFLIIDFSIFQNRTGVPILHILFAMPSTCDSSFDHPIFIKSSRIQF